MMRLILLFVIAFACAPATAQAQNFDMTDFGRTPIQHEGLIKPLDSFARNILLILNGHEAVENVSAQSWLAEALFDPSQNLQRPVFRLFKPGLLGLEPRENRLYSYAEIAPALEEKSNVIARLLERNENDLSEDQQEILRIHESSVIYLQLLRSFSLILPLNLDPPSFLKLNTSKPFTLEDLSKYGRQVEEKLKSILVKKGANPEKFTTEELKIAEFSFKIKILEQGGNNNLLLRVFPGSGAEWFSPWMIGNSGQGNPKTAAYFNLWKELANAYVGHDISAWKLLSKTIADQGAAFAPQSPLKTEVLFNKAHPLAFAMALYFVALLLLIIHAIKTNKWFLGLASLALGAGIVFHLLTIAARVFILSRPPVGTLYESILFVALICSITGFFLAKMKKDSTGLLIGSAAGLGLLFVAQGFAQDNTMPVLVAVLNTNFWLATHVLCITTGYAWCLVTSFIAHIALYRQAKGTDITDITKALKMLALTSLLFTAVGTILGGIWADQSWGRFWGWDPKENGALLIVLWLIWVLHGRISGHLNPLQSTSLLAGLSVIVALAWFGVNLLSTGLHSYGFIQGVATGLTLFCLTEILIIFLLYHFANKARRGA